MEAVKRQLFVEGLRLREANDGKSSRTIEGTAIVFNRKSNLIFIDDWTVDEREVILPQAITKEFLDTQDFVLTLYHNPEVVLGRSNHGQGTLKYEVREDGVHFSCEMPNTQHGDEALELVRSGILTGCSFIFTTDYFDKKNVECRIEDGTKVYYVSHIDGIYDFTLTYRPAYNDTDCAARDLIKRLREDANPNKEDDMTDEQLNTLAEKVADLVEERMKARVDEDPKDEPTDNPEPQADPQPAADQPDAPADAPVDTPTDDNVDDEKERSMKDSLDLIKRALNDIA